MSGFSPDWLRRREPLDAAARSRDLSRRFARALADRQPGVLRPVDLAAGTGANFRALAPLLGRDQEWLLVDFDPALLVALPGEIARWARRHGWRCEQADGTVTVRTDEATWRVRSRRLDLAQSLEQLDPGAFDGVTTTAFLDLVSAAWLERFSAWLARGGGPLLATLTVDGRREWRPAATADPLVDRAFRDHQSSDKGFGPSLGGAAAMRLAGRLGSLGFEVLTARSDWRIGAEDPGMLLQLLEESVAVARETAPQAAAAITEWSAQRSALIEAGRLALEVGHVDLLALPPERG